MEYPLQADKYGGFRDSKPGNLEQVLVSKWLFKLLNEEDLWQDVLKRKYVKDKSLS